jgi:protoheme IX farnesyltransferase
MLPVVAGAAVTRRQIMLYAVLMLPLTLLPWGMGFAGIVYGVGAALLSLVFIAGAARILIARTDAAARWMFRYSIVYLAAIFALLVADKALQGIV